MTNRELAEDLKSIKVDQSELNTAMKDAGAYLTENENKLLTALIENLPTIIEALEK